MTGPKSGDAGIAISIVAVMGIALFAAYFTIAMAIANFDWCEADPETIYLEGFQNTFCATKESEAP